MSIRAAHRVCAGQPWTKTALGGRRAAAHARTSQARAKSLCRQHRAIEQASHQQQHRQYRHHRGIVAPWCVQVVGPTSTSVSLVEAPLIPQDWNNTAVLIDKPPGWTSHDVCAKLRNRVKLKAGHAGTLDPAATGLLILCFGKGTKSINFFQGLDKSYTGDLRLGEGTGSYDAETPVEVTSAWDHITDDDISAASKTFLGDILQTPPMFSAIKKNGVRMYKKARRGEKIHLEPRPVRIEAFDVWRNPGEDPQILHFSVKCSKGTYVRSLVHDLGEKLGTYAHMLSLRRTCIGSYQVDKAWNLENLVEKIESSQKEAEEFTSGG